MNLNSFDYTVRQTNVYTVNLIDLLMNDLQVKCDQYWPSRGTETYGMIQVTMLDTVELATYSVRTFSLYKVRSMKNHYSICSMKLY